jgi:2-dehydro-3-deoxygluconokinase
VDVTHVVWTPEDRVGTYYMERGQPPRESRITYDRSDSAMSRMKPEDWPSAVTQAGATKVFHTTGITLGLSPAAAATAMHAAKLAKQAGALVSFDFNYRSRLWSPEEAKHVCEPLLHLSDFIFLPDRDAKSVCKVDLPDPEQTLEELCFAYPHSTVVLTLGEHGAAARDPSGQYWYQPTWPAVEVERLGGGDAFAAGFLNGYLETKSVAQALRWGAAMAAIKYTTPGDLPIIDRQTVERLLSGSSDVGIAR